jgi:hypothetical protein
MYRSSGIAGARPENIAPLKSEAKSNSFGELTRLLEDSEDLVTGNALHLGNAVGITENNTNLKPKRDRRC